MITSAESRELLGVYRDGLLDDTLGFWFPRCLDEEHGGYLTMRDRDGALVDDDKGIWQQGRAAWLLGTLYHAVEARADWMTWARSGIAFLDRHGFDPADGRMWFHVARDGRPIRKRRYAYSEAFAAIAYGAWARAAGDQIYAGKAAVCFQRFVDHNLHPPPETPPKFTSTRPAIGFGFPMIGLAVAQELREAIGLPDADRWIDRFLADIRTYFVKPDLRAVMETVAPDGAVIDHIDGRTLNPGHAIEGAWFILREARRRGDGDLTRLGCSMLDWMWERGWDRTHGGLLYFTDLHGGPVQEYWHDMKFWWPHNEAIIATLYAHLLTGEDRYLEMHRQVHAWAHHHFADPEHGEWFGYLHRDGTRASTFKGNLWKGPFHLPRMQLTCWKLLEETG